MRMRQYSSLPHSPTGVGIEAALQFMSNPVAPFVLQAYFATLSMDCCLVIGVKN